MHQIQEEKQNKIKRKDMVMKQNNDQKTRIVY